MRKPTKLYRHGKFVRDLDPNEGYVLADGESFSIAFNFMDAMPVFDSAGHRPGFVSVTDTAQDQRVQVYLDRKVALSRQWQDVAPLPSAAPQAAPVTTAALKLTGDARVDAYARRNAALERQWEVA